MAGKQDIKNSNPPGHRWRIVFLTQTVAGQNTVTISWYNDKGVQLTASRISISQPCVDNTSIRQYLAESAEVVREKSTLVAYPNPSTDKFNIVITSSSDDKIDVAIVSLLGQSMFTKKVAGGTIVLEVDATSYRPGIYVLRVRQSTGSQTLKLLKK